MKGSIRMVLGFLIAYGAVGHMDYDPSANLLTQFTLAMAGLLIMSSGVNAMQRGKHDV